MDGLSGGAPYEVLTVTPYSPTFGAEISNIDLTRPLTDQELAELKRAFVEYMVLFFRDQKISFDDHLRLAKYFGPLGHHLGPNPHSVDSDESYWVRKFHADADSTHVSGNIWHSDQSCAQIPPMASILYLHTVPPNNGGDTAYANMYAAYDALSDRMKTYLNGLTAYNDGINRFGEGAPNSVHPLVVRHPESGKKLLFVTKAFTKRILEVTEEESDAVLKYLVEHCLRPEWNMRFHWRDHSIALWDNRCVQHRAIWDYFPHTRSGYRVQIEGTVAPVAGWDDDTPVPRDQEEKRGFYG